MTNAADPKEVKSSEKKERRTRLQELQDLNWVLSTSKGRRFYWRLMEFCETMRLSYTRGDTHETAFRQGMANVGHKLLADMMDANKEAYMLAREENTEEEENGGSDGDGNKDGSKDGDSGS